jgi:hypothetical protein
VLRLRVVCSHCSSRSVYVQPGVLLVYYTLRCVSFKFYSAPTA